MAENVANHYSTNLTASIGTADVTLTVASATGAPAPSFRIIIESEYLLVTGVSGNTFTVTRGVEGSTAATHGNGTTVTQLVTAEGLLQFVRDHAPVTSVAGSTGAVSAIPAANVTGLAISLSTANVIHTTPVSFTNDGTGSFSGTLPLKTQTANTFFAGPTSGAAATGTMRAIVLADVPYPTTTKGDLIVGGASGVVSRLGVGTDGQSVVADSTQTLGVRWGTVSGGGSGVSYTTSFTNSSLSSGVLTVTHNLGTRYISVTIYDNNNNVLLPTAITATSANALTIDFTGLTPLTGTWNVIVGTGAGAIAAEPSIFSGRLTLTSGTPITSSDVTAATTLYFTPYRGARVSLYGGGSWSTLTFAETSVAVPSTTNTPFDIFAYNNAGTLALEVTNWTNTTTRATVLTTQDGVYVKSGATTRRYLGTGCTTGTSGQCEDSGLRRLLWNFHHRIPRRLFNAISTANWTYATASWRSANNSTANRVECVIGLQEVLVIVDYGILISPPANVSGYAGIGEDSTSSPDSANSIGSFTGLNSIVTNNPLTVTLRKHPAVGYHYYQALEYANGGTVNFYGTGTSLVYTGLSGEIQG